jgi:hypothetical protein
MFNDQFFLLPSPLPLASGDDAYPVTPSDTLDLPSAARALRSVGAGNIAVYTRSGKSVSRVMAFTAGETRFGRFTRVLATGTTVVGTIEAMT